VTVAVGYLAGKSGRSPLYLAAEAARTLKTTLTVVTVVPRPWMTPSLGRIDAEYAQYADQLAANSAKEAQACIDSIAEGLDVKFHKVAHRSVSGGLLEAISELEPEVLILGSAADGKLGPGGGRLDRRPAAALLTGSSGDQPTRLSRVESR